MIALLIAAGTACSLGAPDVAQSSTVELAASSIPEGRVDDAVDFLATGFPNAGSDQLLILRAAEAVLQNECYLRNGLDWQAPPIPIVLGSSGPPLTDLELLMVPVDGYGLSSSLRISDLESPSRADGDLPPGWPAPPPEWTEVQYGPEERRMEILYPDGAVLFVPVGGCIAEAREQLYGLPIEDFERSRAGSPRAGELVDLVVGDAVVAGSLRLWADCMETAGYPMDSPLDILDHVVLVAGADGPGEAGSAADRTALIEAVERDVARADARCKDDSHLSKIVADAVVRDGSELIGERQVAAARLAQAYDRGLRVASELLAE